MIFWSQSAKRDRRRQLSYIAEDNPDAAERIDDEIDRQTDLLAEFPMLGRTGRVPGTRELVINRSPFVLVFSVSNDGIKVLRMLHGAQKWPRSVDRRHRG